MQTCELEHKCRVAVIKIQGTATQAIREYIERATELEQRADERVKAAEDSAAADSHFLGAAQDRLRLLEEERIAHIRLLEDAHTRVQNLEQVLSLFLCDFVVLSCFFFSLSFSLSRTRLLCESLIR